MIFFAAEISGFGSRLSLLHKASLKIKCRLPLLCIVVGGGPSATPATVKLLAARKNLALSIIRIRLSKFCRSNLPLTLTDAFVRFTPGHRSSLRRCSHQWRLSVTVSALERSGRVTMQR